MRRTGHPPFWKARSACENRNRGRACLEEAVNGGEGDGWERAPAVTAELPPAASHLERAISIDRSGSQIAAETGDFEAIAIDLNRARRIEREWWHG
jgi:hypothetical protein